MTNARSSVNRFRSALAVLFLLVLSFAFCFPLLKELNLSGRGDWDYNFSLYEVLSLSLFEYGQIPLWNPYCGGGIPLIGNPHAGLISPTFFLNALFGVIPGLKISVWLHTFFGLWGMWLVSGHLGIKGPARLLPSLIFMFSSSWALHLAVGHASWLPAAFLPFLFLTFLKGFENRRWFVAAAIFESLMFYEGGTYVMAFSLLFLLVYAGAQALQERSWQPVFAFLAINLIAAALCAPKLLPVLELLGSHPRPTDAGSAISWDAYLTLLTDGRQPIDPDWWEYGSYFGLPVVILYLFSMALFRKYRPLVSASLFLFLVSLGNFAQFSPWNLLHRLPLFAGFLVPTRAMIVVGFSVALLAGLFVGQAEKAADRRIAVLAGLLVVIIGGDLFWTCSRIFAEAYKPAVVNLIRDWKPVRIPTALYHLPPGATIGIFRSVPTVHQPFSQVRVPGFERFIHGAYSDQLLPLLQNKGVVDAYETIPFGNYARSATDKDYKGEFYLLNGGMAVLRDWSPNRFVYHVTLQRPDRLVINQNFWPGWHASRGDLARHEGLLAIDLPPGDFDVAVRYLPRSFSGRCLNFPGHRGRNLHGTPGDGERAYFRPFEPRSRFSRKLTTLNTKAATNACQKPET